MIIRPATREDIEAFSPMRDKPSVRAWCMDAGGKIIALGGVALSGGRWFAFVDLDDEARRHKVALARAAIRFFAMLRREGIKFVYAEADPEESGSIAWMTRLGFVKDLRTNYLYRWSLQ